MIDIEQPAMALNDVRERTPAQMWNTFYVQTTDTRQHIIDWVAHVARNVTAEGRLKNLVICCEGKPAYLELGEGFDRRHVALFERWRGLIDKIWLRACQFNSYETPITRAIGEGGVFCSEIAQAAECEVIASMDALYLGKGKPLPYGELDGFDGLVLAFAADGTVTKWSNLYQHYEQSVGRAKTGYLN
jgi:hypothetical protein